MPSRPRSLTSVDRARPTCYKCLRPSTHCVCNLVEPFQAHCNLLIIQHPHERRKYHSTTKLVLKAVQNSTRLRGVEFEARTIQNLIGKTTPYLLYPCKDAVDCTEVSLGKTDTVIVVDGTWDEAQKIVYRNPLLRTFPSLSFSQALRSNYRIRKQPRANYLSTLESVAYLLKFNALAQGNVASSAKYETLLDGFNAMVEQQLRYKLLTDAA